MGRQLRGRTDANRAVCARRNWGRPPPPRGV